MDIRGLYAIAYDRILNVARTITDLVDAENITAEHISEAINYGNLDRLTRLRSLRPSSHKIHIDSI